MGDCLPKCPMGAIKITEREAEAYDEKAVQQRKMAKMQSEMKSGGLVLRSASEGGCPGKAMRTFNRGVAPVGGSRSYATDIDVQSQLAQWPCQIRLVPVKAPYFNGAKLLIAADCTAFAYANFHLEFMRWKVTIMGCPKLDPVDYSEKLTEILRENDIKSVTIVRMEVPCCGGLEMAAKKALQASGKFIPWQIVTFSLDGRILD